MCLDEPAILVYGVLVGRRERHLRTADCGLRRAQMLTRRAQDGPQTDCPDTNQVQ